MPEVFCNTSPLQYLHQLGLLRLLSEFYTRVTVPEAVAREVDAGRALGVNLPDLKTLDWISVWAVPNPPVFAPGDLDRGEWEVLALAAQTPDSLVVIDDGLARRYARLHRIKFTGTLGLLLKAKQQGRVLTLQLDEHVGRFEVAVQNPRLVGVMTCSCCAHGLKAPP